MAIDLQAAANEYLGWLQLEANRSPNTVGLMRPSSTS
jgi:hypothetical protein